jgi:hypothetical protein
MDARAAIHGVIARLEAELQTEQVRAVRGSRHHVTARLEGAREALAALGPDPLATARTVAGYEIGDPSWADVIIEAYLDPEAARRDHPDAFEPDPAA